MHIVYAMTAFYPYGSAYASRTLNFVRMLESMGHSVTVFCDYLSANIDTELDGEAKFEGTTIVYCCKNRRTIDKLSVMFRTPKKLDKYLKKHHVDLIITSSVANRFERVMRIARKHHIPLMLESCEKYHPTNWKYGRWDWRYIQFTHCWNSEYHKANGVIAISRFIEKYFAKKNVKTVRIPTILDVQNSLWSDRRQRQPHISFVFAGGLGGGKDRLAEFIEAMYQINGKTKRQAVLNVYGPTKEAVAAQLGNKKCLLDELGDRIVFHGRIPQDSVATAVMKCDFGLILRPNRESSHAGFPTKLAEYMQVGTPVFANDTGDIGMYLINGMNGYLLETSTVDDIASKLRDVLNLDDMRLNTLRTAARKTAEQSFDYRTYVKQMQGFIETIVSEQETY